MAHQNPFTLPYFPHAAAATHIYERRYQPGFNLHGLSGFWSDIAAVALAIV